MVSGAALLRPSAQRAWGAAATLVAVLPGNVEMAVDAGALVDAVSIALWLRLPLQFPLVVWAARCARTDTAAGPQGGTGPGIARRCRPAAEPAPGHTEGG